MLRRRQKVLHLSRSRAVVIPHGIESADEATLAVDRLLLVDPRGEFSEADLGRMLEHLQPLIWKTEAEDDEDGNLRRARKGSGNRA